MRNVLMPLALLLICIISSAQRTYKPASVLASGNWFKISVNREGVYKMDMAFLGSLGLGGNIPSAQVRLYGNGGGMLPESNSELPVDDLEENAIFISDGGDGQLNGADYILFYTRGPHHWYKDSLNKRFTHRKNIFSDKAYYYLSIGGNGLRIPVQQGNFPASATVTSFDERYFHELDTVNFLGSGKEWYGEEFSSAPGRTLSRSFSLPLTNLLPQQATLVTSVAARSVNAPSVFSFSINNQPVSQVAVNPISAAMYDLFAQQAQEPATFILSQPSAILNVQYQQGSFNSQGWLNWFRVFARKELVMTPGNQLLFRDWNSVGPGNVEFNITGADAAAQVWDVTDPFRPVLMNTSFNSGSLRFSNDASRLREYVSFSGSFHIPEAEGQVSKQNLHQTTEKDYFIITYPPFISEALRIAEFHEQRSNLRTIVVTPEQIFNEFSSGIPDPTAIRDYLKMYYDRYQATWNNSGKYVLFVGRASFDYKDRIQGNTNFVPAYETFNSLDPLASYTSDDFFGFLDDQEDINSAVVVNELDIGIGRIPARSLEEVRNFVDKMLEYHSEQAFGPWRNNLNFIADDEDFNLHLQDAEELTTTVSATAPVFNQQKIYLDAFQQESGSAGGRYPQANAMINNNIYNGTLFWNYSGHGGPQRLAEEVVIDQQIVNNWNNRYRLPLFLTATCDFAPYDNPLLNSLGENLLVRPRTGAIALMTTTRVVFAFSNRILNNNYLKFALERDASGNYRTLGEAMRVAKNYTYTTSGDLTNNRKFTLLGDPAMTIAFPYYRSVLTKVNGTDVQNQADTISAGEMVVMEGEVRDIQGNIMNQFNGLAYLAVFDKEQTITTLANDATSQPVAFKARENSLFKGKASVQDGKFSFSFRVPKDINYQYGNGKVSLYVQDGSRDGNGFSENVIIGGITGGISSDQEGPEIKAYLNDESFVNGSITNASPVLILNLEDSSGINIGGSGVGHDIVATLDNDNNRYFVLNNFYESEVDDYQKGKVRFQLPELAPGTHSLHIKAWDVMNNSSEYILDFTVIENGELKIDRVLNYPNPFTSNTSFWFEHNQPGTELSVKVEIFTVTGKLIKTITQTINTPGNRSSEVAWNGRDDFGTRIGRGVYVYRLRVRSASGNTAEKWERLVILGK